MTISGMMNAGLSGLNSVSRSLNVTSDNIANTNTVGYRSSRAVFEDVLNRTVTGVGTIGGGSRVSKIENLFHQGSIIGSTRKTDMAISGAGFFTVRGRYNGLESSYFTRNGQFATDRDGYLVTPTGLRLQGYSADTRGNLLPTLGDLRVNTGVISPAATTTMNLQMQLQGNPDDPIQAAGLANLDPTDPTTFNGSTSFPVYDSLGGRHDTDIYFRNLGGNTWEYIAQVPGADVVGGTAGTPETIGFGTLTIAADGTVTTTANTTTVDFRGAVPGQLVNFDFTDATAVHRPLGSGYQLRAATQDGGGAGEYVDMHIDSNGTVVASYDNGRQQTVGKVALASFRAETSLRRTGGTLFSATPSSGDPAIGFAGIGGRGTVQGGALERSNVDLSTEFVRLISDQRAYQATSRTVTTADELLVETVNLKR